MAELQPNYASAAASAAAAATASCSPRASTSARYAALASAVSRDGLTGLNSTLGARDDLLLTFGSVSLASFVTNWVESLRGAGEWRLLVGALDDELLAQISGAGAPAVRIGGGEVGGGAYFRKDYEVFKKMGARKVGFLAALADAAPAGIWVCDADMVWLRPPPAELVHRAALVATSCFSTDCLDLAATARRVRCDGHQHRRAIRAEDARAALPRRVGGEDGGGAARAVARRPGGLQRARARRLRPERRRRRDCTRRRAAR